MTAVARFQNGKKVDIIFYFQFSHSALGTIGTQHPCHSLFTGFVYHGYLANVIDMEIKSRYRYGKNTFKL